MTNTLLLTLLTAYALCMAIMFIVPAGWMPKGSTPDKVVNEKRLWQKGFYHRRCGNYHYTITHHLLTSLIFFGPVPTLI